MTLNINNLGKVCEALHGARSKSYNIGMMLEVPPGTLNSIRAVYSDPLDQLRETLKAWLKMPTQQKWQTIVKMLRSCVISEPALASDIEATYCQGTPGQASGQAVPKDSQIQALQQKVTEVLQDLESNLPQQETTLCKLIWQRDGPKVPEAMCRGSAATDGTLVYCNGYNSVTVHQYHSDSERWSTMPNLPNVYSTLVVAGRKLISVGGSELPDLNGPINSLLSLTRGRWLQLFPPMPTKRHSTAAICHDRSLIIAGGHDDHNELATVEVLNMDTQLWSIASSLPHPFSEATITVCGDRLYLLGGHSTDRKSNPILICSISNLLHSCQILSQSTIWWHVADAPYKASSCATLCGQLVAVGGIDEAKKATTAIFVYNESTGSWLPMEAMKEPRWWALVASLHDNTMMVVGGLQLDQERIDTVEIATCF